LMEYDNMIDSITNYADTAIQYGFTVLFVTALPIAAFLSLFNNYVKVKFRAWKLFSFYQRPIPNGAQDIGTWQAIFAIISVAAVVTNGALVCFTMTAIQGFTYYAKLWVFIGFQWTLIAIQFIAKFIIDDEPMDVVIQKQRMEFIRRKIIEKVEDEDYGEEYEISDEYNTEHDDDVVDNTSNGYSCSLSVYYCRGIKKGRRRKRHKKILDHSPIISVLSYPFDQPNNTDVGDMEMAETSHLLSDNIQFYASPKLD